MTAQDALTELRKRLLAHCEDVETKWSRVDAGDDWQCLCRERSQGLRVARRMAGLLIDEITQAEKNQLNT